MASILLVKTFACDNLNTLITVDTIRIIYVGVCIHVIYKRMHIIYKTLLVKKSVLVKATSNVS